MAPTLVFTLSIRVLHSGSCSSVMLAGASSRGALGNRRAAASRRRVNHGSGGGVWEKSTRRKPYLRPPARHFLPKSRKFLPRNVVNSADLGDRTGRFSGRGNPSNAFCNDLRRRVVGGCSASDISNPALSC